MAAGTSNNALAAWLQGQAPAVMAIAGSYLGGLFIGWGARRTIKLTSIIACIAMALCAIAVLASSFRVVFEVGLPSLLAFGAFTLTAIPTGHLFGGPHPSDRTSLAIACSSRHIGLTLLIAANAPGQHALELVVAYLLASAVVSIP